MKVGRIAVAVAEVARRGQRSGRHGRTRLLGKAATATSSSGVVGIFDAGKKGVVFSHGFEREIIFL